jgi:hypothetical protein
MTDSLFIRPPENLKDFQPEFTKAETMLGFEAELTGGESWPPVSIDE